MTCLCGFDSEAKENLRPSYYNPKWTDEIEKFIDIIGSFHMKNDYDNERRVSLYACPKCKTIQMSDIY